MIYCLDLFTYEIEINFVAIYTFNNNNNYYNK